jgi:RNA polymerase sigma-70 factor, ECF subfamily
MKPTERDDESLMAAYVAGDLIAFRELFARYAPLLRSMIAARPGTKNDVADLVQQTFLQLHRARHDFDPRYKLRPWLLTIALNLRRQEARRKYRSPEVPLDLDLDAGVVDGATPPTVVEPAVHVRRAVAALPAEQREAIELHWIAGLSFHEIASVMGISAGAARVRAHRGYRSLRNIFGSEPPEQEPRNVESPSQKRPEESLLRPPSLRTQASTLLGKRGSKERPARTTT